MENQKNNSIKLSNSNKKKFIEKNKNSERIIPKKYHKLTNETKVNLLGLKSIRLNSQSNFNIIFIL